MKTACSYIIGGVAALVILVNLGLHGVKFMQNTVSGMIPYPVHIRVLQHTTASNLEWIPPRYVEGLLSDYLQQLGVTSYEYAVLMRIAREESSFDRLAANPSSAARGLFQYMPLTFAYHGCGLDIWDWWAQTRCALQDVRAGMLGQWEVTKNWQ